MEASATELLEALVEFFARTAEICVISIPEREDGIEEMLQAWRRVRVEQSPERRGVVWRIAIPPGTCDE